MQHYPAIDTGGAASVSSPTLLVLAHGAGAGQRHPFMVTVARGLAERGIDVITFDFPYMQQKRRAPDKAPVLEASFRDAIVEARSRLAPEHRVFIGGKSMGGRIATHLAAQRGNPTTDGVVRGVIALGYPLHPPSRPEQPRTSHLPAIDVPILIVQGDRDTFGTPDELRPVIAQLRAPVTLHVVPKGDHSLTVPKSSGFSQPDVYASVCDVIVSWMNTQTAKEP